MYTNLNARLLKLMNELHALNLPVSFDGNRLTFTVSGFDPLLNVIENAVSDLKAETGEAPGQEDAYTAVIDHNELIKRIVQFQREPANASSGPVSAFVMDSVKEITGVELDIADYSTAGNIIDQAVAALDEALPNGQLVRASLALVALNHGAALLTQWMKVKGYSDDYEQIQKWMELKVKVADKEEVVLYTDSKNDVLIRNTIFVQLGDRKGKDYVRARVGVKKMGGFNVAQS